MFKKILAIVMVMALGLTAFALGASASEASGITVTAAANPAHGATVRAGARIEYAITVRNTGTTALTNIAVTNQMPLGTTLLAGSITAGGAVNAGGAVAWVIPTLAAGASAELAFAVTVNELPAGQNTRTISNTAEAGGNASNEVQHFVTREEEGGDGWWANFFPQLAAFYNWAFDALTSALVWGVEIIILIVFGNIRDIF